MLKKANDLVLVIGPCGAGKTTYARASYPDYAQPDRESLIRALTPDGALHYYPELRTLSALLQKQAVRHLLAKGIAVCVTAGGTTRKERAEWREVAALVGARFSCIRVVVEAETCIARARADPHRPASSKDQWAAIVSHWFRDFEPVDPVAEGMAFYQEVQR
jgi:predicted kinase